MLIYVKNIKKKKKKLFTDGRTDRRTTQNYSSEPHNKIKKNFLYVLLFAHLTIKKSLMPSKRNQSTCSIRVHFFASASSNSCQQVARSLFLCAELLASPTDLVAPLVSSPDLGLLNLQSDRPELGLLPLLLAILWSESWRSVGGFRLKNFLNAFCARISSLLRRLYLSLDEKSIMNKYADLI